jgi:hypothetical protein
MGSVIMAKVKLISFQMTELHEHKHWCTIADGDQLTQAQLAKYSMAQEDHADHSR